MNKTGKKALSLAVAGAFASPAAALAQGSSVQIFGTMYVEYAYIHQGQIATGGDLVNADILQTPNSEIGIRGQEQLGGGVTAWFQCASTADVRGPGTNAFPNGVFCGRNSAIGLKGSWGNVFAGNWDSPMRRTQAAVRIVNDLGIFGVTPMLFGATSPPLSAGPTQVTLDSTFNGGSGQFSRRVNNSLSYESPVWQGVQVFAMVSAQSAATGTSNNASAGKPRLWSIAANYTNGPLLLTAAYEVHQNFNTGSPVALPPFPYQGTDTGWQIGAAYQAGPVKVGGLYTYQSYDLGTFGGLLPAQDLKVSAWNLAAEWAIQGPHALRGAYTKANDTKGNSILGFTNGLFNRNANGGAGNTGAHQWQIQYVYNASKRTELAAGYIRLQNDTLGGYYLDGGTNFTALGINQDAFAVSMKHSF